MSFDDLGDRMKGYEGVWKQKLPRKLPVIVRVDGKAFHSYLKGSEKPFDMKFIDQMASTAKTLCEQMQGAVLAYHQSDEISILLQDWESVHTEPWFGGELQKITSISASIASVSLQRLRNGSPLFDARAFVLPSMLEVANYLIWRQRDAIRNSVSMAAHAHFSHKSLQGVTSDQMQEKLWDDKGINWAAFPDECKRGTLTRKNYIYETVEYVDKRTGKTEATKALRGKWQYEAAPHFTTKTLLEDVLPKLDS